METTNETRRVNLRTQRALAEARSEAREAMARLSVRMPREQSPALQGVSAFREATRILQAALVLLLLCTGCDTWRANPAESTEIELGGDLSPAQVAGVYNAVLELNTATGRELFHVVESHAGFAGHVTITADAPLCDDCQAETRLRQYAARIRLGTSAQPWLIAHELLHVFLGPTEEHSTDPSDLFYARVSRRSVLTDATLARIEAMTAE